MQHSRMRSTAIRRKIWNSIRILRRFTLPDICRTVPETSYVNARKYVAQMRTHGIVAKQGKPVSGRGGSYQIFSLSRDLGPEAPTVCPRCGQSLAAPACGAEGTEAQSAANKQTKKQRNKQRNKQHNRAAAHRQR